MKDYQIISELFCTLCTIFQIIVSVFIFLTDSELLIPRHCKPLRPGSYIFHPTVIAKETIYSCITHNKHCVSIWCEIRRLVERPLGPDHGDRQMMVVLVKHPRPP